MSLTGCMSMLTYGTATQEQDIKTHTTVADDVIRYIGYPAHEGVQQKGMLLMGEKYAYLMSQGSNQLQAMTQLEVKNTTVLTPITVDRYADNSIKAVIDFDYRKPNSAYTADEKQRLNEMCVSVDSQPLNPHAVTDYFYQCRIELQGGLYQASQQHTLSQQVISSGYKVTIRQVGNKKIKNYNDLMVMPLAVVIDIVTIPLQVLWIGSALMSPFD